VFDILYLYQYHKAIFVECVLGNFICLMQKSMCCNAKQKNITGFVRMEKYSTALYIQYILQEGGHGERHFETERVL